jgi:hypothetical protein
VRIIVHLMERTTHTNAALALGCTALEADTYATLRVIGYSAQDARNMILQGRKARHAMDWQDRA